MVGKGLVRPLILALLAILPLVMAATSAAAAAVTVAWDPNTESDLAGYVVSYGTQSGVYSTSVDVGNTTSWTISTLAAGQRYYFVVQAYNTSGLFSPYSDEVNVLTEPPPATPTIASVSPSSGPTTGGTALTIVGTNFAAGAFVTIGSVQAASTVVVNATTINAVTAPGAAGTYDVRVTNPSGQSAVKTAAFTYVPTTVTVTDVAPRSGLTTGGTAITITGANFSAGATVRVGGVAASSVTVLGPTTITAVTPPHAAGSVEVRVTNPDGRTGALAGAFTYVSGRPAPTAVAPSRGSHAGGTAVTISGSNFAAGATVKFGGVNALNVVVAGATTITATTPPAPAPPGDLSPLAVDVIVTNPDGQSGTVTGGFVYESAPPAVGGVWPPTGPVAGGTSVTITGSNFFPGVTVRFGGVPATGVVLLSATKIAAVTPAHAAGAVEVTVSYPGGLAGSLPGGFVFVDESGETDTDGDGLPDAWEATYGLDPASASGDDGADGDPDGDGKPNADEYRDGTHPRGFVTRYFAEGVNSTFFTTVFAVANASASPARAVFHFLTSRGQVVHVPVAVGPLTRLTFDSRSVPAVAAQAFSTMIESDALVVIDRTVTWDSRRYGAHAETAIESPSTVWYLAEGATHSGFDLFYLIQNPNAQTAEIEVKYLLPSGPPIVKTYRVGPSSRFNIWVDLEDPRLVHTDVSAVITCTNGLPIIVERSMYLNAGNRPFGAGHNSAGVTAPSTRWFLAEGATGPFFDLFLLLANPGDQAAEVRATYLLPDGTTLTKPYRVAPNSRFNIWVDLEDPRLADTAVSTTIESTNGVPILVERTMWWPGPTFATWVESHNSFGTTTTGPRWALAEGEEGGPDNRSTYILVANTSPTAAQVRVTLLFEDGTTVSRDYTLAARSRFNVAVGVEFPTARGRRFGAIVESVGATPAELVVERAMYWDEGSVPWAAGTNAVATRIP